IKRMVSEGKSEELAQELKGPETRDDDELKNRWRSLYRTKPPHKIHRSLLIAAVAHRMQENALGALKSSVRRNLMQAANNRNWVNNSISSGERPITENGFRG